LAGHAPRDGANTRCELVSGVTCRAAGGPYLGVLVAAGELALGAVCPAGEAERPSAGVAGPRGVRAQDHVATEADSRRFRPWDYEEGPLLPYHDLAGLDAT
jgi:hypothetical protein